MLFVADYLAISDLLRIITKFNLYFKNKGNKS